MNRRSFLKKMAVTGAMASVVGQMDIAPGLFSSSKAMAAERNKLVFISDLHLNVDTAYSWMVTHVEDLATFIESLNSRTDVAELIILGDMLDDWVLPAEESPRAFSQILEAPHNAPAVAALQDICQNSEIQVTYVTGNHDLLSFESENKAVISNAFPNMTILSDDPGLAAYTKDNVIWAEHGHRYTLFNAPDVWSYKGNHLPLGYFISRLAASKSVIDGRIYTTPDVLNFWAKATAEELNRSRSDRDTYAVGPGLEGRVDDVLIVAIFNAIALWAGKKPRDLFIMDGKENFIVDPLVEKIALLYDEIFSKWPVRQNIINKVGAFWNDLGSLNVTADLLLNMPARIQNYYPFAPRIVLFGHTHKATFQLHAGAQETIYANTGTWIDTSPMSWVEVEINEQDSNQRSYGVSLWFYGETEPRQSGTIVVP
ncbi:MAG: metallophosphoesterase [Desulfatirhabdiaceae bacterium]